jgi:high-affinity iron transporter
MPRKASALGLVVAALALVPTAPARGADVKQGSVIFAARCAFCHGTAGKGDGPAGVALKPRPTNFTSAQYWETTSIEHIEDVIANGKPGTAMVAFKGTLGREQIEDVAAYLQTLKARP